MPSEKLVVYLHHKPVGHLWQKDKYYCFQYVSEASEPVSLSLPLQNDPYTDDFAKPFFSNLLPEGEGRTTLETSLGIARGDDFGLLKSIGGDCAGAISLLPEDQPLGQTTTYTPLTDDDVGRMVAALPYNPLGIGPGTKVRLSLAGAQNKLALYIDAAGHYYLPEDGAPSSHIIKAPITNIAGITDTVQNETFVMMLADELGLRTPEVCIKHVGSTAVFVTMRYDRYRDAEGVVQRILQEDFCQILRFEPTMKYQNTGGPSLEDCANVIREHSSNSIMDIEQLLKWVAFNILVGNADAHAKNISMLWGAEGVRLAPFYDMLSTAVYGNHHDTEFAMSIGREYYPEKLSWKNWKELSDFLDINIKLVTRINGSLASALESALTRTLCLFEGQYGRNDLVTAIARIARERVRYILPHH